MMEGEEDLPVEDAAKSPLVQSAVTCLGPRDGEAESKSEEAAVMSLAGGAPQLWGALKEAAAARIRAREALNKPKSDSDKKPKSNSTKTEKATASPRVDLAWHEEKWGMTIPLILFSAVVGGLYLLVQKLYETREPAGNEK